jgi:dipeptidyl aminopeptidase/acylaminoacyl peptidase
LSGEADFNYHLMKIRIGAAGAIPERLPYIAEQVYRPSIPTHGNRLAYSQDFFDADIWEIQPGKPPRPFASSTRLDFLPQYSPDGSRIAFCSDRSGQMEIWTSDHDGRNPAPLTNSSEHSCSPQWSPDGHWIAFDRHMKDTWHIFLMAADGGQEHQLTSDDTGEMVPNWSRDGRWLYFASNRTGRFEIWKMPSAGGERMQVTHNGGWTAFESFDGRSLYYTKNLNNHDDYSGLWVLPLNTAGEERRILDSIPSRSFTVTQDGIYYIPTPAEDGSTSLRFRNFATGTDQPIAPIKRDFFGGLTVSPDRQTILFSMATRTGSNVMIVDNFR